MTPEQQHALVIQRAQADAAQAHWDARERHAKEEERAAIREQRRQQVQAVGAAVWTQLKAVPPLYKRALWIVSGEEDSILYRFLHVFVPLLCLAILGITAYAVFSTVVGWIAG
jgi:antibiotic biosynthesis monooxygenase (ABM) superfamily enzyme